MSCRPARCRTRSVVIITGLALSAACEQGGGDGAPAPAVTAAAPEPDPIPPAAAAWFRNEARSRGLVFRHDSGARPGRVFMPEIMCGGVALFDADADGDLDCYLVQAGDIRAEADTRLPNALFRNDGNGHFTDVTGEAGDAAERGYGMGVATGDFDGDGAVDLYITNVGRNTLLRNDGRGRFADVTMEAGVGDTGFGASAAFVDYDHDGDLDLFVTNYIRWRPETELACFSRNGEPDYCSPNAYQAPAPDTLYRNEGDGTFTDVSAAAGLQTRFGNGLGVVCADFDGDGWIDIFVANDGRDDQLWVNRGDGTFADHASQLGVAVDRFGVAKAGMGVDAADYDDDGDVDLLVVNLATESDTFMRNMGDYFIDDTAAVGLGLSTMALTRFGVGLVDFDNDGRLDDFVAAGKVRRGGVVHAEDPFAEPNALLVGTATGRLERVEAYATDAADLVHTSRGAAFGDVDGDGRVDVVVVNRDAQPYLLMNRAKTGHWLAVRVFDADDRDALGAVVEATAAGRTLTRLVRTAHSYCSASDPRVNLGLGAAGTVDELRVRWLDGSVETYGAVSTVNRVITIRYGEGRPVRTSSERREP